MAIMIYLSRDIKRYRKTTSSRYKYYDKTDDSEYDKSSQSNSESETDDNEYYQLSKRLMDSEVVNNQIYTTMRKVKDHSRIFKDKVIVSWAVSTLMEILSKSQVREVSTTESNTPEYIKIY
ncbi:hypothetical protein C7212DRAFT_343990 [Tuber magnatum]|uniref:Uncharacterized protein n=1 Tax=Tuber magnatum TaxID=42249 RepID=A0A317SQG2_9PEZI|nr:hypothetical protein C7212DRAFT_343990 [Tuber magnatum]